MRDKKAGKDFTNLYRIIVRGRDFRDCTYVRARSLVDAARILKRDGYAGDGIVFVGYVEK